MKKIFWTVVWAFFIIGVIVGAVVEIQNYNSNNGILRTLGGICISGICGGIVDALIGALAFGLLYLLLRPFYLIWRKKEDAKKEDTPDAIKANVQPDQEVTIEGQTEGKKEGLNENSWMWILCIIIVIVIVIFISSHL